MDDDFKREVLERLIVLETILKEQDYKSVKSTSDKALNLSESNEARITKLENNLKWVVSLVLSAVILGILKFTLNI